MLIFGNPWTEINSSASSAPLIPAHRPSATVGHSGAVPPNDCLCPPNESCAPPSEDCAPKKLISSGLLECKSRPETRKIVLIALEFVSKNCFLVIFVCTHADFHETSRIFWIKTFFFGLHLFRLIHTLEFT